MKGTGTTSVQVIRAVAAGVAAAGLDVGPFLAELGVAAAGLLDPDGRVPFAVAVEAWELAARRTGDASFGVHLVERLASGTFGVVEYAMLSSASGGEAIRRLLRYQRLLNDDVRFDLRIEGEEACLRHAVAGDARGAPRQAAEFALGHLTLLLRRITGDEEAVLSVTFRHARPADTTAHQRVLRAPLRFDGPHNEVVFAHAVLDRPVAGADPGLSAILARHADTLLERLPPEKTLLSRIRQLVIEGLRGGEPSLAAIAAQLKMSERTVQRALREGGTSYHELLDSSRRDLATRYLQQGPLTIGEVAFLLGFSEPSAFHRAFRRWTGLTPAEFRRGGAQPAP